MKKMLSTYVPLHGRTATASCWLLAPIRPPSPSASTDELGAVLDPHPLRQPPPSPYRAPEHLAATEPRRERGSEKVVDDTMMAGREMVFQELRATAESKGVMEGEPAEAHH